MTLFDLFAGRASRPPFWTDSIVIYCSNIDVVAQWWIEKLDGKKVKLPNWDNPLPSDVAVQLPGHEQPTILLTSRVEFENAGFSVSSATVPILFTSNVKNAYRYLSEKHASTGAIQTDGESEFFEVRDPEGNVLEICKTP